MYFGRKEYTFKTNIIDNNNNPHVKKQYTNWKKQNKNSGKKLRNLFTNVKRNN